MQGTECFLLLDVMSVCNPSYSLVCFLLLLFVVALSSSAGIAPPYPPSTKRQRQDIASEGSASSRSNRAIFIEHGNVLPSEGCRSVHVGDGRSGGALRVKRGAITTVVKVGSSGDRPSRSNSNHRTTTIATNSRSGAHAVTTSTQTTGSYFVGVSMLAKRILTALKSGVLAMVDVGTRSASSTTPDGILRRRGTTPPVFAIFVALVCILTVAAANVAHTAVPRILAGRRASGTSGRKGAPPAAVVENVVLPTGEHNPEGGAAGVFGVSGSEGQREGSGPPSSSFRGRMKLWQEQRRKGREERVTKYGSKRKDRLLLRTPSFPLAHTSWRQAWQDRPRVRGWLSV